MQPITALEYSKISRFVLLLCLSRGPHAAVDIVTAAGRRTYVIIIIQIYMTVYMYVYTVTRRPTHQCEGVHCSSVALAVLRSSHHVHVIVVVDSILIHIDKMSRGAQ